MKTEPTALQSEASALTRKHSRRGVIGAVGLGAAALAVRAGPAGAIGSSPDAGLTPVPKPIPGGIDAPPVGFIHWWLPGPEGTSTPVLEIPGFGLDVDPSTITDFEGETAFAVIAGTTRGSDGTDHLCEVDVRVMNGHYLDESGGRHRAAFAFL